MRKSLITCLLAGQLLVLDPACAEPQEDFNISQPMVDLIYKKLVSTMFLYEFENEKNKTAKNSAQIQLLGQKIETLRTELQTAIEEELGKIRNNPQQQVTLGSFDTIRRIEALEEENLRLRARLDRVDMHLLQNQIPQKTQPAPVVHTRSAETEGEAMLTGADVLVKSRPTSNSRTLGSLQKNELISVSDCDRFGWCALIGRQGFVARHLLLRKN